MHLYSSSVAAEPLQQQRNNDGYGAFLLPVSQLASPAAERFPESQTVHHDAVPMYTQSTQSII